MFRHYKYLKILTITVVFQILFFNIIVIYDVGLFPENNVAHKQMIIKKLHINDYCLSTESRHTRHISMQDLVAAFQDYPGFYDHFPSSSFIQSSDSIKFK
jgi:hypothetical protein